MTGDDDRPPPNRGQQQGEEQRAHKAAAEGDPRQMVEALHRGFVLDGITRAIRRRFPRFPADAVDSIVAEAVTNFYSYVVSGKKVFNVGGFLFKAAEARAIEYERGRVDEVLLEPAVIEILGENRGRYVPSPDSFSSAAHDEAANEAAMEERRVKCLSIVQGLIPRLGQYNVCAVMSYIIEAVAAGCRDISNREIEEALGLTPDTVRQSKSRGFRRLATLAMSEGLVNAEFIRSLGRYEDALGDRDEEQD